MRRQLGTYFLTGASALFLGLMPTLVTSWAPLKWILASLVVVAFAVGVSFRPWRESEATKRRREYDRAKIVAATQQDITSIELEMAELRRGLAEPTLRDLAEASADGQFALSGAAASIIAAGRSYQAEQDRQREISQIKLEGLTKRYEALRKIVEGE